MEHSEVIVGYTHFEIKVLELLMSPEVDKFPGPDCVSIPHCVWFDLAG